jgi:hypothetical protein
VKESEIIYLNLNLRSHGSKRFFSPTSLSKIQRR